MLTKPNSYQLVLENGQLILRLLPGLTEAPWSEIEQAGFEAVSEVQKLSKPQVVVDLTQLSYIGSSQVALVIRVWKAVKVQDGALVVATSNSTVREVLALSGLDRVWKLVETSQEAQAALGRRDIQPTLDNDQSDASPPGLCTAGGLCRGNSGSHCLRDGCDCTRENLVGYRWCHGTCCRRLGIVDHLWHVAVVCREWSLSRDCTRFDLLHFATAQSRISPQGVRGSRGNCGRSGCFAGSSQSGKT